MIDAAMLNLVAAVAAVTWALSLRIRPLSLLPATAIVLQVVIVQAWVLASAACGLLDIQSWRAVALLLAVALIMIWRHPPAGMRDELAFIRHRTRRIARRIGPGRLALGSALLLAMLLITLTAGCVIGQRVFDVISYHLPPPADWIAHGRIVTLDWPDARSWWPGGHGLMAAWWMLPLRDFGALRIAMLAETHWLLLSWAAVWALARRLGASARQAWLAVVLSVAVPVTWAQITSDMNDLPIAALLLTALAAVARRPVRRSHLALAGAAFALGCGIKPTMLILAMPLGAAMIWQAWRSRGVPVSKRRPAAPWLALILAALLLGGFWYVRNAVATGNPLYPAGITVAGTKILTGSPQVDHNTGHVGLAPLVRNLRVLVTERLWDIWPLKDGGTPYATGFGPMAVSLGLVSIFALAMRSARSRVTLTTAAAMALLLCASVDSDPYFGRFFMFVPLIGAVCIALVTPRIAARAPRLLWNVTLALSFALATAHGIGVALSHEVQAGGTNPVVHEMASVPEDAHVAVAYFQAIGPTAELHGPALRRKLLYHNGLPDAAEVAAWRGIGVRWILVYGDTETAQKSRAPLTQLGLIRRAEHLYEIP